MIPCERAIEMCDVIPDVSVDIPSDLILVKEGTDRKHTGITSHISMGLSQRIML